MRRGTGGRRRGLSLIMMAIVLVVLIGFIGLGLDIGFALIAAHQLQNTADAAALAGAMSMKTGGEDGARNAAALVAANNIVINSAIQLDLNTTNAPEGDIVIGRYDRFNGIFEPGIVAANAIKVVARRTDTSVNGPLVLFFGGLFGVNSINVERTAIAQNKGATGAGIIALCSDCDSAFKVTGTADIVINFGAVQVNSTDPCAVRGIGTGTVDAALLTIGGDVCANANVTLPDNIQTGQPPGSDPLAAIPEPTYDPLIDLGIITGTGVYSPGYYSGGIDATGGDITLLPGIYILDGAGLQLGGNVNFLAEGVMIYIPPGTGLVDMRGTGIVQISPPDPDLYSFAGVDTYDHITIFQSRTNCNEATIIGTGLMDLDGVFYFACATLRIGGTGADLGSQLVANTIDVFGNGLSVSWDGSFPSDGNIVFLVQ